MCGPTHEIVYYHTQLTTMSFNIFLSNVVVVVVVVVSVDFYKNKKVRVNCETPPVTRVYVYVLEVFLVIR